MQHNPGPSCRPYPCRCLSPAPPPCVYALSTLLTGCPSACRNSFIRTGTSWVGTKRSGRSAALISGEAPPPPKEGCLVCGRAQLQLSVNTHTMTLQQLLDKVGGWLGA